MAKKKRQPQLPPLEELCEEGLAELSFPEFLIHLLGKSDAHSNQSQEAIKAYQSAESALCKSEDDKTRLANAVLKAMDVAAKSGITPLDEMASRISALHARRSHRETDGMKRDVFAWLVENDHKYATPWSAARAITNGKLVKLKHKTLLGYVQEFRSQQRGPAAMGDLPSTD